MAENTHKNRIPVDLDRVRNQVNRIIGEPEATLLLHSAIAELAAFRAGKATLAVSEHINIKIAPKIVIKDQCDEAEILEALADGYEEMVSSLRAMVDHVRSRARSRQEETKNG